MQLTVDTVRHFTEHAFDRLLAVAERLGDERVDERPVGSLTNSVAALVVHCCGVAEYWFAHVALGEPSNRDRAAEFTATRRVAELRDLVESTRAAVARCLARIDAEPRRSDAGRPLLYGGDTSDGAIVLHVLEELFQHLGHAELTLDVLTGGRP